ncbi:hypothetical protein R1flu_019537 [Riccia fluitans]|uniref:Uncharacterized protein n=1 Tax=Riccia fluitans TaxID=41844 RepID=A0ABD1ZMR9_9MARC
MDKDMQNLQAGIAGVEHVAEQFLLARQQMMECDKARNATREALTSLRKQARTSVSSVIQQRRPLITEIGEAAPPEKCLTCGDHDGTTPLYVTCRSADVFVRLPFHETHCLLEKEQERLERTMKTLQSTVKEKTMSLSEKGGKAHLADNPTATHIRTESTSASNSQPFSTILTIQICSISSPSLSLLARHVLAFT